MLALLLGAAGAARAQGLSDPALAKAADRCLKGSTKATAGYAAAKAKSLKKCVDKLYACVQLKPADVNCFVKAGSACTKEIAKIDTAASKLAAALVKACPETSIPFSVLRGPDAGDLELLADACTAAGVPALASLGDWGECLRRRVDCAAEATIASGAPRSADLLALVGLDFESPWCLVPAGPSPTPTPTSTPSPFASPTATPDVATPSPTDGSTPAPTATATPGPLPTATPFEADTPTPTPTTTDPPTPSPTATRTPGPHNVVFVTSQAYAAAFGGTAGADQICAQHAAAAGLPGTYVAWLSTTTQKASDRLGTARGFVRPDGAPFADEVVADIVTANRIWHPLVVDENAQRVPAGETVWTGTPANGSLTTNTCGNWTSSSGSTITGRTDGGPAAWTEAGSDGCAATRRLYCFGTDRTGPLALDPPPAGSKLAFVTTQGFNPSQGIAVADNICQSQAADENLTGTYRALLATTGASAASRFPDFLTSVYVRPDGVVIGDGGIIAAGGALASGIWQNADGTYLGNESTVAWTGSITPSATQNQGSTCNDWSGSGSGIRGKATLADGQWWSGVAGASCSNAAKLYCLEQ